MMKGIDDFLAAQQNPEKALDDLENKALSLNKFMSPDHRDEVLRALKLTYGSFDRIALEALVKMIAKTLARQREDDTCRIAR
jgi:hypothetical protein